MGLPSTSQELDQKLRVTVVGEGYVGLSLAVLFARRHDVCVLEIDYKRVCDINRRVSPIADAPLEACLANSCLVLKATSDARASLTSAEFNVVATPTDYDPETNQFDTSPVDEVVHQALQLSKSDLLVIKSTLSLGYTESLQRRYQTNRIISSPVFLREGHALQDNLQPSRIIVSNEAPQSRRFAELLLQGALSPEVETTLMASTEAEAVKLFANTYSAMRVSFFNELDSYALACALDTKKS